MFLRKRINVSLCFGQTLGKIGRVQQVYTDSDIKVEVSGLYLYFDWHLRTISVVF